MTLTKFEAELRLDAEETYKSMKRRLDSMTMAAQRHQQWGKNKNAGIHGALMTALREIDERVRMAHIMGLGREDNDPVSRMYRTELNAYYPVIRRMYDVFVMSRLLEPSEVTESTMEGGIREASQRVRDNPVTVWAHDDGCTVDHIPRGPGARYKNCPTAEEWDE